MKNTRVIFYCFVALLVTSCYNEPEDFPNEPIIRVTDVKTEFRNDNIIIEGERNIVTISLEFQDGDGDLGISPAERNDSSSVFAPTLIIDGVRKINPFYNNYFLDVYRVENGNRKLLTFLDNVTYNSSFDRLIKDGSSSAIEGTLIQTISIPLGLRVQAGPPIQVGDTIDFDIQIADRAFNLSNTESTVNNRIVLLGN